MASEQEFMSLISELLSIEDPGELDKGNAYSAEAGARAHITHKSNHLLFQHYGNGFPLRKLISFISRNLSHDIDPELEPDFEKDLELLPHFGKVLSLEPELELISLIRQVVSFVISTDPKWKKLISVNRRRRYPFFCRGCNDKNHNENNKALVEIKHPLHPKHSLRLALLQKSLETRQCYCCDKDLKELVYCCLACDYAMTIACVENPVVRSTYLSKWHGHTLALFPRQTPFACSVGALTHTSCPFYICPPCDFAIHQSCMSLPSLIRISRHVHRIKFIHSFGQGDWSCSVCRRDINNDYGGYSCTKLGCSYAAHSKCATQRNVWGGKDLEGIPEENDEGEPPFVRISAGIIEHFSHQCHRLKLDEDTCREYDVNKLCQACTTPIYSGNLYSCMQCDYILHEVCANLSRKIHHPIHPHMLTLERGSQDHLEPCSACPWMCKAGFFYKCQEKGQDEDYFSLHVQCATLTEPLVHKSHDHSLYLTSKPEEQRRCSVCKESGHCSTKETFNCIKCDNFALCFECATIPEEVRYEHDEHMLTLSYREETSTMTYWCEICEKKIDQKERLYMCGEYCCVTLHIVCLLGLNLYVKPGSYWEDNLNDKARSIFARSINHRMSRPICDYCKKRCPHKIVLVRFPSSRSTFCSTSCIRGFLLSISCAYCKKRCPYEITMTLSLSSEASFCSGYCVRGFLSKVDTEKMHGYILEE